MYHSRKAIINRKVILEEDSIEEDKDMDVEHVERVKVLDAKIVVENLRDAFADNDEQELKKLKGVESMLKDPIPCDKTPAPNFALPPWMRLWVSTISRVMMEHWKLSRGDHTLDAFKLSSTTKEPMPVEFENVNVILDTTNESFSLGFFRENEITALEPILSIAPNYKFIGSSLRLPNPPLPNTRKAKSRIYVFHAMLCFVPGGVGHYIAHIRDPDSDRWYVFDDRSVKPVTIDRVRGTIRSVIYI
ncbi:hypothetical protein INT47_007383 [Mucor saturninus]|uniref:Peptidase C19 ubiquitin carboxyl-terminal hydrolase domain-containing protein n=1 Tax=Mucor saturninus TaxID=64648 RepID=A0A8H7QXJ4_9FUNG|nr:hypothetical protein INT47_007383 [Mucor saturninus]